MRAIAKLDLDTTLVTHLLLSQYGMNKVIKIFGVIGVRAVQKDLEQIHNMKVVQPRLYRYINV